MNKTLIVGVGNEFRSDDAAGLITARMLKKKNLPDADIIEHGGDGASLMDIWVNYESVIIIDATNISSEPGKVYILDANKSKLPKGIASHSSHLFSIAEAVETARVMGKLPQRLMIYGIEGKNFNIGEDITEVVLKASCSVAEKILNEMSI